eukprot:gnl/TRDRNA2_/TRDRNA2_197474_c0_seq1.p1 gnl/TRDRNA2_/TRDRNA2_197474_c0~~gnl/TRDRNA2_/TRDRNA2_197474_c0_seq1.p1  ORF type:complete len:272 (+),score=30.53 gnl/TRDRNA2_/TRDRNA2_197474_c0_seq1:31-816(+)
MHDHGAAPRQGRLHARDSRAASDDQPGMLGSLVHYTVHRPTYWTCILSYAVLAVAHLIDAVFFLQMSPEQYNFERALRQSTEYPRTAQEEWPPTVLYPWWHMLSMSVCEITSLVLMACGKCVLGGLLLLFDFGGGASAIQLVFHGGTFSERHEAMWPLHHILVVLAAMTVLTAPKCEAVQDASAARYASRTRLLMVVAALVTGALASCCLYAGLGIRPVVRGRLVTPPFKDALIFPPEWPTPFDASSSPSIATAAAGAGEL